jgi:hypothetical protein
MLDILIRIVLSLVGLAIVVRTLLSAVRTFILPRSANDQLTRFVFLVSRRLFNIVLKKADTYKQRDEIMALYAPITLLALPPAWLACVMAGYTLLYRATGIESFHDALLISGASLLTFGASLNVIPLALISFTEGTIGLILVAVIISYLPTMYSAFSRREAAVTMLEVRAGSPPSAVEMIVRYYRIRGIDELREIWESWEAWFAEIEETHTSLAALAYFRSPKPDRSWITAAGAVLDAAALVDSTIDQPRDPNTNLCIRAGFLALRTIADFFHIPYNAAPTKDDPISISRDEYDAAYDRLAAEGVPVKPDREAAWLNYKGWRVNYDTVLLALCTLTMAPYAPWSSDRSLRPTSRIKSPFTATGLNR